MFRPTVTPGQAFLYLGAAMSITAFPMLARIVQERGLTGTPLGTLALAAGRWTTPQRGPCSRSSWRPSETSP